MEYNNDKNMAFVYIYIFFIYFSLLVPSQVPSLYLNESNELKEFWDDWISASNHTVPNRRDEI
jgi:hypothetical protein